MLSPFSEVNESNASLSHFAAKSPPSVGRRPLTRVYALALLIVLSPSHKAGSGLSSFGDGEADVNTLRLTIADDKSPSGSLRLVKDSTFRASGPHRRSTSAGAPLANAPPLNVEILEAIPAA
jgi:hypothetical protein